ncbi:MAG: AbrB/MazE/SpoVT family DNA-binding domain-containing protein [Thermoproteota archaeon]|jgi:AbrB family looped-hinge helix DNA binding protein|nr:AbrB/MazE/SpoVT family DNA-binding domain-containing protein [Thermoproteota archaeon]
MPKVTTNFQITIPKEVREKIDLKPGEEFEVIVLNNNEILLRRKFKRIRNPLKVLIGKKEWKEEISPEKLDELSEE